MKIIRADNLNHKYTCVDERGVKFEIEIPIEFQHRDKKPEYLLAEIETRRSQKPIQKEEIKPKHIRYIPRWISLVMSIESVLLLGFILNYFIHLYR